MPRIFLSLSGLASGILSGQVSRQEIEDPTTLFFFNCMEQGVEPTLAIVLERNVGETIADEQRSTLELLKNLPNTAGDRVSYRPRSESDRSYAELNYFLEKHGYEPIDATGERSYSPSIAAQQIRLVRQLDPFTWPADHP